ncbi:MAG TPA: hypothetical protein VND90_03060 [Terracidiphilus sp.]|nr:hypothetical protein [Terracidiphilus sp.]
MQQLNVHDYYELGKHNDAIENVVSKAEGPILLKSIVWSLFLARWGYNTILATPCALLPASQRAAHVVVDAISAIVPEAVEEIFAIDANATIAPYSIGSITDSIKNFETILKNDMPEMSTFAVTQIGIFRTEDLIYRSYLQIDEDLRKLLEPLALEDITQAGKCLAFSLPTASAFHLSRAIETCMNQYYEALTGNPFDLSSVANNWGVKTQALKDNGADAKITEFLIHIRRAYRNPITHPDVILEAGEALALFPQAISVISMMLAAVKALRKDEQPMLEGLYSGLTASMLEAGLEPLSLEAREDIDSEGPREPL